MKGISKNFLALTAMQASSATLPLIIFPYSLAILGEKQYANIVLTEAIAMLAVALVLYSFEIDGVRQIVGLDAQRNRDYISRVLSGIIEIRILLFLVSTPVVLFIAWVLDTKLLPMMTCWLLLPLSYALQPAWLYQGLEDNFIIAVTVVSSRFAATAILLIFLNEQNYILVPFIVSGMFLIGSILALGYSIHHYQIRFEWLKWKELRGMLMSGRYLFASNISVAFYRDVNVLILGFVGSSSEAISIYSMAEKIVKMIQAGIRPINQIYTPKALRLTVNSFRPNRILFGKMMTLIWPQLALLCGTFGVGALIYGYIQDKVHWLYHLYNQKDILFLALIMSIAAFAGVANYMLGMIGLSSTGASRYLFWSVICVGVSNLIIASFLINIFDQLGAAISFVAAEIILLTVISTKYIKNNH